MIAAKKFTVVKLVEVSEPGRNPYKVVPTFWIKNENSNNVTVPYPSEDELVLAFERVFNCQLPLAEWAENPAVIQCEADTYQGGMLYIKRQNSAPLDEETLLIWKQISMDYVEQLGSLHPISIFRQLYIRFVNLFGK